MQQRNKKSNRLVKYRSPKHGLGFEFIVLTLDTKKLIFESGVFGKLSDAKLSAYQYLRGVKQ